MDKKHTVACFECGTPLLASYRAVRKRCRECWRKRWRERKRAQYAASPEHYRELYRRHAQKPEVRERRRRQGAIQKYVSEEAAARGVPNAVIWEELRRPKVVIHAPTMEILGKIGKSPAIR